jgi:hypothetical protein
MREHWDTRYTQEAFSYGIHANDFFSQSLAKLKIGKILLPGEGEGRNAVYAASHGWEVDAFDFSEKGRNKALGLAEEHKLFFNEYSISDYSDYKPRDNHYDVVGLIYAHAVPEIRSLLHYKMINALKTGGVIILQGFSKLQLGKDSGGPKQLDMLYSVDEMSKDFAGLSIELLEQKEVELSEGIYHQGAASVINMIAKKL